MKNIIAKTTLTSIILSVLFALPAQAASGEDLVFDRKKGNCIACHAMPTANPKKANLAGNIAPPIVAMKARYPDKSVLRAQIYDATAKNPDSLMPPFGKYEALSQAEVDSITNYIYTL